MQIETYEIEEICGSEASTMAADAESIDLIDKLGLVGQKSLSNTDTLTRFPYPRLTSTQEAVFLALFPAKAEVSEYRSGIIPLRVLQVIVFCRDMPQTKYIEVWHSNIPKADPVLIGAPSSYNNERYLLARWGEALEPFEKLLAQALPLTKAKLNSEISRAILKLQGYANDLDGIVRVYLETGEKPTWNIYD